MENKKIIIAGGTGFIGQELARYFAPSNSVIILTRGLEKVKNNSFGNPSFSHDGPSIKRVQWNANTGGEWVKELEGAELLINLSGKTVNCRYTKKNKKEIFDSRINATRALGMAVHQLTRPPRLWINASSATIYPHATDSPRDESFTDFADDFSVQVCQAWEKAFFEQRTPFTRKIVLRMAITIGSGGILTPYFNLLKFGLGGKQGNGKQLYSWVHISDTCRIIEWLTDHQEMEGIVNCVSPGVVNNKTFMKTLRKVTGHVFGLPAFEWMLRMGALIIGTEPELVLKSRWVLPGRLIGSGFVFQYSELEGAFREIISKTNRKKYHLF